MSNSTFYYSQMALSTYQTCQLKFRRRYIEELYWPRPVNEQIEMGQNFHLLSQRYFSTGNAGAGDRELAIWLQSLQKFMPLNKDITYFPEQELRLNDGEMRLVARYDLVTVSATDKVLIYDWKTDEREPIRKYLERSIQTMVYRYLMVKAGSGCLSKNVSPSNVVMIYWNPRFPNLSVTIPYDEKQFQRDDKELKRLITEIEGKEADNFWPTTEEEICNRCEYSPICQGVTCDYPEDTEPDDLALSWDDIEDVFF